MVTRAVGEINDTGAFYDDLLDITPKRVGSLSFYHGPAGVYAVQALVAHARGDAALRSSATQAFIDICRQPCEVLDLTLGCAGALLGCALLFEAFAHDGLRTVGDDIRNGIWRMLDGRLPIARSPELGAMGMAHGWPGLLYATLCWSGVTGQAVSEPIRGRLQELAECAEPIDRGLQWVPGAALPSVAPSLSSWCNGSAGLVFLWTKAWAIVGEQSYLELAEGAAWNTWEAPNPSPTLCCGMAGQAYALMNFYRACGDAAWLRRARSVARSAAANPEGHPASLYKGGAALAVLCADLETPDHARMPAFECEG